MVEPPTGTITFLFTDIEGSTKLWEQYPQQMRSALARHDAILRNAIETNSGYVFKTIGDAFCAAFYTASKGLAAAVAAQRILQVILWGDTGPLRVRMALHTGVAESRDSDYFGPPLNRVARLLSTGYGGQVLLSQLTSELVRDSLKGNMSLRDLGQHHLKDLIEPERIFQLVVPDLPANFASLKTLDTHPNNLPVQPTTFIGREREVEAIQQRLMRPDVRLLTLSGPGGVGKTRMALQVAAEVLEEFADGVFFIRLSVISDPNLIAYAIAHELGIREVVGSPLTESLRDYVRNKNMLLILDNFEHVLQAAHVVTELMSEPNLKIIVTSRAVLGVYGEHNFNVPPLELPDAGSLPPVEQLAQCEAIRLFIERAQAIRTDFALTAQNANAVAEICRRLDGLPLAIELAAARIRLLPPQAMLVRLENRLGLLVGGARDMPTRQQTLRRTLDWSYDLLDTDEQKLFAQLSVFVGGWRLEAAEVICGVGGVGAGQQGTAVNVSDNVQPLIPLPIDLLDGVASLVDKSLLRQQENIENEAHFEMLQTIREYALEKLEMSGEGETLRRHHAKYYRALAEDAEAQLRGPKQLAWLQRLEAKHDDLRAALTWLLEQDQGDVEQGLRLAGTLWRFWWARGYLGEGRRWLEAALAKSNTQPTPARAKALYGAGVLAQDQGDYAQAGAFYENSLEMAQDLGDKRGIASALNGIGFLGIHQGDYMRASESLEKSLELFRECNDKSGVASALHNLGWAASCQGECAQASVLYKESLTLRQELRDKRGISFTLKGLAGLAAYQGDYETARLLYKESLALAQELRDKGGIASAQDGLGWVSLCQGDYAQASELLEGSLMLFRQLGDKDVISHCLEGLAGVAGANERPTHAAQLFGAAEGLREIIGSPQSPAERPRYQKYLSIARAKLDETAWEAIWTEGRAMSMEEAISYALVALANLDHAT